MNSGELSAILDDIVASIGEILVTHAELTESMVDDAATSTAAASLERLKKRTAAAKNKLADLKDRQRHKRDVEQRRKKRERQATNESVSRLRRVQLLNAQGRLIGWLHNEQNGKVTVYDARGRLVARELNGITLDRTGRFVGRGRQGLLILGKTLGEPR